MTDRAGAGSAGTLGTLLEQSTFYVNANTAGLGAGDDRVEVPNGGNSMNWILGHIVWWRNDMIERVGGRRIWEGGVGDQYRGNPGERRPRSFDPVSAIEFAELKSAFEEAGRRLKRALEGTRIDAETEATLLSLLGHEVYHAGQLGVLRRIAGRAGAL